MAYTLHHGDCLDILPTLPAQSVDAVIADPPYGTTACKWDSVIPFEPMWAELKRVIRPRGAIVLFGSQPFTSALVMSNPKMFRYEWVWEKDKATGYLDAARRPLKEHENVLIFSVNTAIYYPQKSIGHKPANVSYAGKLTPAGKLYRGEHTTTDQGGQTDRFPRTIMRFNVASKEGAQLHPTQKPLALLEYLVKTYTNEGNTVLDFTMGSGTTGEACVNTGRNFIGIEKERQYYDIAQARLDRAALTEQQLELV